MTFREAIRKALADSMEKDRNVVLFGEDIGVYGGCFKVTEGLYARFPEQVIDTPVSEEGFTGMAVGAAMMGIRPVVEIMYADFFTLIFDPIVNHASKTHFMSGGRFSCPIVVRLPEGSGTGHGAQHTQSPEALFLNEPGIKMVAPSNPSDAYNLLVSAIADNNPVLFFEHKLLYPLEGEIDSTSVPIGKSKVVREGKDITIFAYSHATVTAMETAELLEKQGISACVVDLRTLKPLDRQTILENAKATGRVFMIQDTAPLGSVGSELISLITTDKEAFSALKAQPVLISGKHSHTPFSKELEKNSIPDAGHCASVILKNL